LSFPDSEQSRQDMNQRRQFLEYFFHALKDTDYALLKFIHNTIDALPETSDIDLAIDRKDRKEILNIIRKGANLARVHVHHKSFAMFVSLLFKDETYLEIDLIHRFDRKGIIYLNADEVIDHAVTRKDGLKVAAETHNFEYVLLYYHCNGSEVPQRYRQYFSTFSFEQRSAIFTHITGRYKVNINTLDELYDLRTRFSKKIQLHVQQRPDNRQPSRFLHKVRYYLDVLRDAIFHRGITVTFSGVDGAGKSTVLEEVKETLQYKYRQRTIVLRHRPTLLPILSSLRYGKEGAEQRAKESLPRQGRNNNIFSSLIRFFYYYADYLLGQYYIFFRYTLRGYTVLYDRYYFDFIIDPRRSNIELPTWFTRWFYMFIFKPEVNVFLFASPEIIKQRKQELSHEDIHHLTSGYRKLFEELGKKTRKQHYLVINNINLDDTLRQVMKECVSATI
jgi:thymidylate kinase